VKSDPKLVIIGLDAATWTLIDPGIAEGRLRNLAKLKRDGVSGPLRSVIPPVTPSAWTSFMTGKNPGKHGGFNFIEHESHGYGFRYGNAASRRSVTVWRLLNQAGFSVGTMNMPFTYPPEPLNGRGPVLKRNVIIEDAQLIDLAPTILHLLGAAVPDDTDGRVLEDAVEPAFLASHPIKTHATTPVISNSDETMGSCTSEEAAKIEERLQALGYLD
jgi:predicted AlkP superfamily phosphohydrolase/phosphomutase